MGTAFCPIANTFCAGSQCMFFDHDLGCLIVKALRTQVGSGDCDDPPLEGGAA